MADEDSYRESGLEKYQILVTLDNRTSDICRSMDGKIFDVKDYNVSITAPPFHARCRSTTIPWFEDFLEDETRAMRDPITNKTERIPHMEYDDWYKIHVASNVTALLQEQMYKNKPQDKKMFENYKRILGKNSPQSFADFKDLKYNNDIEWEELKKQYKVEIEEKYLQDKLNAIDELTGEKYFIPKNTIFENMKTIYKGDEIRVVQNLVKSYGGEPEGWTKRVGKIESEKYIYHIFWYEYDGKQYEPKVKKKKEKI